MRIIQFITFYLVLGVAGWGACSDEKAGTEQSGSDESNDTSLDDNLDSETEFIFDSEQLFAEYDLNGDGCWDGHAEPETKEDIVRLKPFSCIEGDLIVYSTKLTELDLPNLKTIGGELRIEGNWSLLTVEGLSGVTSVGTGKWGESLTLDDNIRLASFRGLEGITALEGRLEIWHNDLIVDLTGLENLTRAKELSIVANNELMQLDSLKNLSTEGMVRVESNRSLISIAGLQSITEVDGYLRIQENRMLPSLNGLQNVSSVGTLYVFGNWELLDISALDTLASGTIDSVTMKENLALPYCAICDWVSTIEGGISEAATVKGNFADACGDENVLTWADVTCP